jgi:hypothetical protein
MKLKLDGPRYVDPPSGWQYGFPKIWDPAVTPSLREFYLANGYPEEDVELALSYTRVWGVKKDG